MTGRPVPRVEIAVDKLVDNARALLCLCESRGIGFTAVTKALCGSPRLAAALYACGVRSFGDSHVRNLRAMKEGGPRAQYMLIRSPTPNEAEETVDCSDISVNGALSVMRLLARAARRRGTIHQVIVMVEMGDLREGIPPEDVDETVSETLRLPGIELAGIGTNLACLNGVAPSAEKMRELSAIADGIERRHGVKLRYVSGGNSASYRWLVSERDHGRVNHLRIGESMLLGCDALTREPIPGLHTDAFTLVAQVAEVATKPSLPYGRIVQDAFGHRPRIADRGRRRRAILGIGRQDIEPDTLRPRIGAEIVGATSDHLVLDATGTNLDVGAEVEFDMGYSSLLRAMLSPYVVKTYSSEAGARGAFMPADASARAFS